MHPSVASAHVRWPRHPRGSSARLAAIRRMLAAGFVLAAIALLLLAGATTPARAADDVASDAVLTVLVQDGDGGGLAGAEVRVTARRDGATIGARGAVAGTDGSVTLDGLPRALGGSPVSLDVVARLTTTWRDDDGCTHEDARTGTATGLIAGTDTTVEVTTDPASSVACDAVWPAPTTTAVAPAAGATHRPTLTPPPTDVHLQHGPAHRLLPGWGWVVLGMICFAVVLGLAWPDHRDRG